MNKQKIKKYALALGLGFGFMIAPGLSSFTTAQAQDWRYEQQRRIEQQQRREQIRRQRQIERQQQRNGGYYGQHDPYANGGVDENGNIDRNQNGIDDRWETRDGRVDRNQDGVADQEDTYDRYSRNEPIYGNGGYYETDNYGYNDAEFQKGYRDGLNRGRSDARTNRAADPNNSSHYRKGNATYRAGFERGFEEGYRQYRNRNW
jgi:hypothetical protein